MNISKWKRRKENKGEKKEKEEENKGEKKETEEENKGEKQKQKRRREDLSNETYFQDEKCRWFLVSHRARSIFIVPK